MSDCCLTPIFQLYHGENKSIFNEMMMRSTFYLINTLSWIFIVLATGVAPLKNKEGFIHSDTTSKAEILNEQCQSVYTKENTSTMPDKGQSKYPSMKDIVINTKGVFKLLND